MSLKQVGSRQRQRIEAKSQPCQPLLVEAAFGGPTVGGYPQWGAPHQDTCLLLKQLLLWGAGSQSLIGTRCCTVPPHARRSGLCGDAPAGSELTF